MKIRCSQIGKIMINPRAKGEVLSATAKTHVQELYLEHEYGIYKEFWSRYTDKGNLVEDEGILMCESLFDGLFLEKNEQKFTNDYLTGVPDVITDDFILDVKSSYTAHTFPFFDKDLPNKDYFYQLQGYMELTGKTDAYVVYCLINTPEEIIQDEIRRESWKRKEISISEEAEEHVRSIHTFDHIPKERRLKAFHVQKDEAVIEQIYERINLCREYYLTLHD
jgi:hypothetical protein